MCKTRPFQRLGHKISNNCHFFTHKEHPAPENPKFCMKKTVFFYSKIPPCLPKNWNCAWKNDKKKWQKRYQKEHPPPHKPEVLHEQMRKNWQKKYQKEHPAPLKTWTVAWKIKNRPTHGDFEKKNWKKIPNPNFTKRLNA